MPLLQRLSAFWGHVSPQKTLLPKTVNYDQDNINTAVDIKTRLKDRQSMSPASKVFSWQLDTPPLLDSASTSTTGLKRKRSSLDVVNLKRRRIVESTAGLKKKRVSATIFPPMRKHTFVADMDQDMDGDTLMDDDTSDLSSLMSNINVASDLEPVAAPPIWTNDDGQDETLIEPATPYHKGFSSPTAATADDAVPAHPTDQLLYPIDAAPLYQHIHARGREPLLPSHWKLDFRFLPDALFTSRHDSASDTNSRAFVSSLRNADFRATKALSDLIGLGPRVRDKVIAKLPPEPLLVRAVEAYMRWALEDAGLAGSKGMGASCTSHKPVLVPPPLLAIHAGGARVPAEVLQAGLMDKFHALAQRHRRAASAATQYSLPGDASEQSPVLPSTLYGCIVSHTLIAVLAWAPPQSSQLQLRQDPFGVVGVFDFGQPEYAVWNALAIAILVVHCRNIGLQLARAGVGEVAVGERRQGWGRGEEGEGGAGESDPDA